MWKNTLHLEDNEFEKIEDSIEKDIKIKLDQAKETLYYMENVMELL